MEVHRVCTHLWYYVPTYNNIYIHIYIHTISSSLVYWYCAVFIIFSRNQRSSSILMPKKSSLFPLLFLPLTWLTDLRWICTTIHAYQQCVFICYSLDQSENDVDEEAFYDEAFIADQKAALERFERLKKNTNEVAHKKDPVEVLYVLYTSTILYIQILHNMYTQSQPQPRLSFPTRDQDHKKESVKVL